MARQAFAASQPRPGSESRPGQGALKICVDGRFIDQPRTGVCHYSSTLMSVLRKNGATPLQLDVGHIAPTKRSRWQDARRYATALRPGARTLRLEQNGVLPGGRRLVGPGLHREARIHFKVYNQLLPLHCEGTPGIMHWTYPVPLYLRGWINIYTVHDMIPLGDGGLSPISPARHRRLICEIARKADRLITVSESARADIIEMLRCAPDFVINGSQAAPVPFDIATEAPEGLPSRSYFLYCGSVEPRKNLERLVEAYRCSGSSKPLVIAGPDGWQAERVKRRIAHVKGVHLLPFQTRERLLGLMQHARALLFPSLAEGFGLPVAEAMAMGTPVMASSIETLAEVTRDCALLVDPLRVEQMSDVIGRLCHDDELCDQMAIKGLARSLEFSSTRYFERLSKIYEDLAKFPPSGPGM